MLSHGYWQTRFAMSPAVVGDTLVVNGVPLTIIGVAPEGFTGTTLGALPRVFVPLSMRERLAAPWKGLENRRSYWAYVFARLQPGANPEAAEAPSTSPSAPSNDVEVDSSRHDQATLARFKGKQVTVRPGAQGQSNLINNARSRLYLLLAVTAFVLLIACANIANLLLARGASRASEMAVRLSIGASRWQVVRQLLVESARLAAIGGALSLLVARATLTGIIAMIPAQTHVLSKRSCLDDGLLGAIAMATGLCSAVPRTPHTRPDW